MSRLYVLIGVAVVRVLAGALGATWLAGPRSAETGAGEAHAEIAGREPAPPEAAADQSKSAPGVEGIVSKIARSAYTRDVEVLARHASPDLRDHYGNLRGFQDHVDANLRSAPEYDQQSQRQSQRRSRRSQSNRRRAREPLRRGCYLPGRAGGCPGRRTRARHGAHGSP